MICVFWHENKQSWKVSSKSVTMREQLGSMVTENWCKIYFKPKVTLPCYNIYLFWILVSGILNVFDSYKSSINYSYDS